jgi:hypothetical protein
MLGNGIGEDNAKADKCKGNEKKETPLTHDAGLFIRICDEAQRTLAREFGDWVPVSSSVQLISTVIHSNWHEKRSLNSAIRLADRHQEYLILRCPTDCPENCVNCRSNEFGSWVQIDHLVGNPFMGTASLHCGARIQISPQPQTPSICQKLKLYRSTLRAFKITKSVAPVSARIANQRLV